MKKIRIRDLISYLIKENLEFEVYDPLNLVQVNEIEQVFSDTRLIEKYYNQAKDRSNIFIAVKGERFDSHSYIKKICIYSNTIFIENENFLEEKEDLYSFAKENNLILIKSKSSRNLMAYVYKFIYNFIDDRLNIFAITGTDGKTSMVTILHLLFSKLFGESASIGTLGVNVNGVKHNFSFSTPTTPEIYDIYNIFHELYLKDVKNIFIEATSIASTQKRLASISFDYLSFTTLASDHLDFHKTLENYYNAKLDFIDQISKSNKKNKILFYNADDKNSNLIEERLRKHNNITNLTYGFKKEADFIIFDYSYVDRLLNIKIGFSDKLIKRYNIPEDKNIITICTNLIGKANVYNIVHSIAYIFAYTLINLKKDVKEFFSLIEKSKDIYSNLFIPGRMERIEFKNHDIFIDYAHTEDSLRNAILTLKDAGYNKIITIMGCGGDRDKTKRPLMGKCSSEFSDFVIVTSDNPRTERPEDIINDIVKGISKKNYIMEVDRLKAIEKGVELLDKEKKPSALLVAGKGHEDYQEIMGVKYPFSDKEAVKKVIKDLN